MKVARSSPLRTGRLYPQEISWYSFLEAFSTSSTLNFDLAAKVDTYYYCVAFVKAEKHIHKKLTSRDYAENCPAG
jgi:hypothetical protein